MTDTETYRPRTNLIFGGIGIVLCGLFIWSSFYQGGVRSEITSALVALFVLITIYIFLIRPKVTFGNEGLIITNPIEEFTISWSDVIQMDTRWAFAVETKEFTVSAWAATSSGRPRLSIHESEIKGLDIDVGGSIRVADSPTTDSGAVAYRAKVRFKRFQSAPTPQTVTTRRKRQLKPLLLAVLTLIAALLVNFVGH